MKFSYAIVVVFAILLAIIISKADARMRIHRMKKSRCTCSKKLTRERDDAYNKINEIIEISERIITINNCLPGQEFKYDEYNEEKDNFEIKCNNCSENYYRSATNSSCLHCPEGYYSKSGWSECKKSKTNTTNVHTLCEKGKIIGSNKFGIHKNSCVNCNSFGEKKYMPFKNNLDTCFTCPPGSIVEYDSTICRECPVGYYEKDNKCIKCEVGTYTDKTGTEKCKVCSNKNALAYVSTGGYNCDNSIFHNFTETINNIINIDGILKPLVYGIHNTIAFVSNI